MSCHVRFLKRICHNPLNASYLSPHFNNTLAPSQARFSNSRPLPTTFHTQPIRLCLHFPDNNILFRPLRVRYTFNTSHRRRKKVIVYVRSLPYAADDRALLDKGKDGKP
jgi:hypothetical protein